MRRNLNLTPEKSLSFSAASGDGMRWACHARELFPNVMMPRNITVSVKRLFTQNNFASHLRYNRRNCGAT